jgi:hypothetical protein
LKDFLLAHGQEFDDDVKETLREQFTQEGLMDEALENALDNNRLWG